MSEAHATTIRPGLRALLVEAAGFTVALALVLLALWHVVSSGRSFILFHDGDSVLLPLMHQSLQHGTSFHWAMSTTLFVPEILLYELCALVTTSLYNTIALNAVINLVVFYAVMRGIAGLTTEPSRLNRVRNAVIGLAIFVAFVCLESSSSYGTFELFSLNMTGTYYWSAVVATGIVVLLIGAAATRAPSWRRIAIVSIGLLVTTVCSYTFNPLFAVWAVAPATFLLILMVFRNRIGRSAFVMVAALLIGTGLGLLVRPLFHAYLPVDGSSYLHLFDVHRALGAFKVAVLTTLRDDQTGLALLVGIFALGVLSVGLALVSWRSGDRRASLFLAVIPGLTGLMLLAGVLVGGQDAPRYLLPAVVLPLMAFPAYVPALTRWWRRVEPPAIRVPRSGIRRALALVVVAVVVAILAVAPTRLHVELADERYPPADCLARWLDGRDLVGAGVYWIVRPLQASGVAHIHLLQVVSTLQVFPWMVDLDTYRVPEVSYVVADHDSAWSQIVRQTLGAPAATISCGGFDIWDYSGTVGQVKLTEAVTSSGRSELAERNW